MKYVALLSGGKDSCYNLVHCARNGHELIVAASLGPEPGKEELDSYLYQTVGQDAIEYVARALEVPLYRQVITGNAVEQGSEYGGRNAGNNGGIAGDETEDLYTLLASVKSHHPDVQGISVGAILSNYQRVRVEHVCSRLGLVPLCYLWQRNQAELLAEMIEGGMEAILIKVAGIGLTKAHLGKTLAEMQPTLTKLNTLYGAHVCGEGGEYESLTLDCPLFKHKIVLTETETVIHSDNDFAIVAFLRIKGANLETKSVLDHKITIPSMVDNESHAVSEAVIDSQKSTMSSSPTKNNHDFFHAELLPPESWQKGPWAVVSNVQSPSSDGGTVEDEVTRCFQILSACLLRHKLRLSNCTVINIFISSMDLFLRVNAVYGTFFGVSPPARACVGVDLPPGVRVKLECIAFAEHKIGDRQALHVQGLSYWAPANIGPYSQAITTGEHVFISGQIGLIPSKLALPYPPSLAIEMALSSQHVERVTTALKDNSGGGWDGHTLLNIYWYTNPHDLVHIKAGHTALRSDSTPTVFLVVKGIPKNALVEKQVLVHTGRCKLVDEDGTEAFESCAPSFRQDEQEFDDGTALSWEVLSLPAAHSSCAMVFLKGDINKQRLHAVKTKLSSTLAAALSVRFFYCPSISGALEHLATPLFEGKRPPITSIPCRRISNLTRDDWDSALCIFSPSSQYDSGNGELVDL